MPFLLRDRVVVLTGAASGIGAALAVLLARYGARLALVDIEPIGLAAVAAEARTHTLHVATFVVDLAHAAQTDPAAIDQLAASVAADLGPAAVLINNAGVALEGSFEQVSAAQFERVLAVNFHAPVHLTRAFLPQLRASAPAQIVALSSIFGIVGVPGQTAYCSSKFALRGFSEALRLELAPAGIGVTVVHPGGVRTRIATSAAVGAGVGPAQLQASRAAAARLLRLDPASAARVIVHGLLRRRKRILVGTDAKFLQLLQRLFPVAYSHIFARLHP